jgi:hypothetical protein
VTRHNTASCGVTSPPFLCLYTEPFHNLKMWLSHPPQMTLVKLDYNYPGPL